MHWISKVSVFIALATPSLFLRCSRHYWSRHCHSSSSGPTTAAHTHTAARRGGKTPPADILTKSFHMGQIYICANLLSNAKLLTIPRHIKQHGAASSWDRRVGCCSNSISSGDSAMLSTLSTRRSRTHWPAGGGTADPLTHNTRRPRPRKATTSADRDPQRPLQKSSTCHHILSKSFHMGQIYIYANLLSNDKAINNS